MLLSLMCYYLRNTCLTEQYLFSKHVPCQPVKTLILFVSLDVFQLFSQLRLFEIPWAAACQVSLSFTISQSFLKLMSPRVGSAMLSSYPLLPPSPSTLNLSQYQNFSNVLALHIRWPKYWSFSISPSSEYSGLISFRVDWFDIHDATPFLSSGYYISFN